MDNQHIILLAAGLVVLYFLWLQCSSEGFDDDERFLDEEFRNAKKAVRKGAKAVGRGARKAGKGVVRGLKKAGKGGAKGPRGGQAIIGGGQRGGGDMSGMTFVCKAVDFGAMARASAAPGAPAPAGSVIGPSAGGRSTKKGGGKGKNRKGPRAHATRGNVADMKTKKGRRQRNNNM